MEFKQSVFYKGSYIGYQVTTEDKNTYHFSVISKPNNIGDVPDDFNGTKNNDQWNFDKPIQEEYQKELLVILKRLRK